MDGGDADFRQAREAIYRDAMLSAASRSAAYTTATSTPIVMATTTAPLRQAVVTCSSVFDNVVSAATSWPAGLAVAGFFLAWYYWPTLGPEILGIEWYGMPHEQELLWLGRIAISLVLGFLRTCWLILWLVMGLTFSALRFVVEYAVGLAMLVVYSLRPRAAGMPMQVENLWYTHEVVIFRQRVRAVRFWIWKYLYHALAVFFILLFIGQKYDQRRLEAEVLENLDVREFHVPDWVIRAQNRHLYDGSSSHYVPEEEVVGTDPIERDVWVERTGSAAESESTDSYSRTLDPYSARELLSLTETRPHTVDVSSSSSGIAVSITKTVESSYSLETMLRHTGSRLSDQDGAFSDTTTVSIQSTSLPETFGMSSNVDAVSEAQVSTRASMKTTQDTSSPTGTAEGSSSYLESVKKSPSTDTSDKGLEGSSSTHTPEECMRSIRTAKENICTDAITTSEHAEPTVRRSTTTRTTEMRYCSSCRQRHCCEIHG